MSEAEMEPIHRVFFTSFSVSLSVDVCECRNQLKRLVSFLKRERCFKTHFKCTVNVALINNSINIVSDRLSSACSRDASICRNYRHTDNHSQTLFAHYRNSSGSCCPNHLYSLDLAPSHLYISGPLKTFQGGRCFRNKTAPSYWETFLSWWRPGTSETLLKTTIKHGENMPAPGTQTDGKPPTRQFVSPYICIQSINLL